MTTATTTRMLIKVTNNNDDGDGSLREAIRQGNEAVKAGKAVEIAFTSSFHIKVKTGYSLEKGDWTFNQKLTKNIIINGENASGPLFQIGNQSNINSAKNPSDIEELKVDITRMHLVNSHVKGGDGKSGGGGGLGAGSALLHFNGHVTWRESSFQGNTVEGGKGAKGAMGGESFYIHAKRFMPKSGFALGTHNQQYANDGVAGQRGGSFNNSSATSHSSRYGKKGLNGWSKSHVGGTYGIITGTNGGHGHNGKLFGEGGGGGAGGGGGSSHDQHSLTGYTGARDGAGSWRHWGDGGRGGNGGNGNFGAGGGAGGSAGANAGHDDFKNGSRYRRSPSWTYKNKQGATGRSGEWASAPTKAGDPDRGNPGSAGRGGDGAALGVISSFATKNEKSSLSFDNVDFRKNEAKGGDNTGRFANIYSRHLTIKYNNITNSKGDSFRGNEIGNGDFNRNINSATTVKSRSYANSGRFKELVPTKSVASQEIFSTSYQVDSSLAQTFGKVYQLGNSGGHTIVLHADQKDSKIHQLEIAGAQELLQSVRDVNNLANETRTEDEIHSTHKGIFGSFTRTGSLKQAATTAAEAAARKGTELLDEQIDKFASKSLAALKSQSKYAFNLGALIGDAIFTQIAEDARIEEELKEKRRIDKARGEINRLIPEELKITPFDPGSQRTYDTFKDFELGRDQIAFTSRIKPIITYRSGLGGEGGVINITSERTDQTGDANSARLIGQIRLTTQQTANALKHGHDAIYFQQFLHLLPGKQDTNWKPYYAIAKDSQWQYFSRPADRKPGGIGNDRIIISRNTGIGTDIVLEANGFEGHDRIKGDSGKNLLKGETGNDFFDPGIGSDIVKGGSGTDTVSYTSLKSSVSISTSANKKEITVTGTAPAWTDKLSDVEVLRTWGGSNHKLTDAKQSSAQGHGYRVQTGATGTTEGSQYDDNLFISYASDFNTDPATTTLEKTTIVNGQQGNDSLLIDGLAAHIEAGQTLKLTYSNISQSSGFITKTTNGSNTKILMFAGISKGVTFTDTEWNSQGLATVKPQTGKQTEHANTNFADVDSDPLIGSTPSHQNDSDVQTDELTGATSAGFSNDNLVSPLQTGTLPQRVKVDSLNSMDPASTTLPAETVESTLASTVSMAHTAWEPGQERQQQPVWAQREFFIDPLA